MKTNLGYLFYKDIYLYNSNSIKVDSSKIKTLINSKFEYNEDFKPVIQNKENTFSLATTYPGLITGTGIPHGINKSDLDFKIGFYFDHTSGLPVIPGSSIKGLLRSIFPNLKKDKQGNFTYKKEAYDLPKACWLTALVKSIEDNNFFKVHQQPVNDVDQKDLEIIYDLKQEIFDGKLKNVPLAIYHRDIFYDAIIESGDDNHHILDLDYITPHKDNPLKNPEPLRFLKVSPKVRFQFQFDLKDGKTLTAQNKLKLFKKILLTIGAGAKTNVGYGQFKIASNTIVTEGPTVEDLVKKIDSYKKDAEIDVKLVEVIDNNTFKFKNIGNSDVFHKPLNYFLNKYEKKKKRLAVKRKEIPPFEAPKIGELFILQVVEDFKKQPFNFRIIPKKITQ